jgi:hypothetical protein
MRIQSSYPDFTDCHQLDVVRNHNYVFPTGLMLSGIILESTGTANIVLFAVGNTFSPID